MTPTITDADRSAAKKIFDANDEPICTSEAFGSVVSLRNFFEQDSLAEHLAAHRTAAVAQERERIVEWIRGLAKAYENFDGKPYSLWGSALTAMRIVGDIEAGKHLKDQSQTTNGEA